MAARVGIEPTINRLTGERCATQLPGIIVLVELRGIEPRLRLCKSHVLPLSLQPQNGAPDRIRTCVLFVRSEMLILSATGALWWRQADSNRRRLRASCALLKLDTKLPPWPEEPELNRRPLDFQSSATTD